MPLLVMIFPKERLRKSFKGSICGMLVHHQITNSKLKEQGDQIYAHRTMSKVLVQIKARYFIYKENVAPKHNLVPNY